MFYLLKFEHVSLPNACHTVEGQEIGQSLHETITIEMGNSNPFLCRKPQKSFSPPVHCILLMMLACVPFCHSVFFPCSFSQCIHCKYKDKQRKWEYWTETEVVEQNHCLHNCTGNTRDFRNPPAVP